VHLTSHLHIPPFIIHNLRSRKPGFFLIREPEHSVVSWSIYWNGRMKLEHALDYYIDFHHSLHRYLADLFIVGFDEAVQNFDQAVHEFNARFGTDYAALRPDEGMRNQCVSFAEERVRGSDGTIDELTVSRPSAKRQAIKPELVATLRASPRLSQKLETANELYATFRQQGGRGVPHRSTLPERRAEFLSSDTAATASK
jgi:hypothetical protein